MGTLEGKVALVTGAAQGIGKAIADGLAAEGARIVVADLQGAERAAEAYPGGVGLTVDVADEAAVARMTAETVERCGGLDVLVNNAGLYASLAMRPFTEIPLDEWRRVMDVNVASMFLTCRAAVPAFRERGGGAIVNVASIVGTNGAPGQVAYGGAKAAVVGMTRSAAKELAPKNVRVNAVAPGMIDTELLSGLNGTRESARQSIGLGRFGTPEEVAGTICFLASDEAAYVTGQVLGVDGGMLL